MQNPANGFPARPLGGGGFYDKLRQQLEDCSPEAYQLMAEALFVQFLIHLAWSDGTGRQAKPGGACFILGSFPCLAFQTTWRLD